MLVAVVKFSCEELILKFWSLDTEPVAVEDGLDVFEELLDLNWLTILVKSVG